MYQKLLQILLIIDFSDSDNLYKKYMEIHFDTTTTNNKYNDFRKSTRLIKVLDVHNSLVSDNDKLDLANLASHHDSVERAINALQKIIDEQNDSEALNKKVIGLKDSLQKSNPNCLKKYPNDISNIDLFKLLNRLLSLLPLYIKFNNLQSYDLNPGKNIDTFINYITNSVESDKQALQTWNNQLAQLYQKYKNIPNAKSIEDLYGFYSKNIDQAINYLKYKILQSEEIYLLNQFDSSSINTIPDETTYPNNIESLIKQLNEKVQNMKSNSLIFQSNNNYKYVKDIATKINYTIDSDILSMNENDKKYVSVLTLYYSQLFTVVSLL